MDRNCDIFNKSLTNMMPVDKALPTFVILQQVKENGRRKKKYLHCSCNLVKLKNGWICSKQQFLLNLLLVFFVVIALVESLKHFSAKGPEPL